MGYQDVVPEILGVYIHIWLGYLLVVLIAVQITTGIAMVRGRSGLLNYHRINAVIIIVVLIIHGYYSYLFNTSVTSSKPSSAAGAQADAIAYVGSI